jgi:hypothetical protein
MSISPSHSPTGPDLPEAVDQNGGTPSVSRALLLRDDSEATARSREDARVGCPPLRCSQDDCIVAREPYLVHPSASR